MILFTDGESHTILTDCGSYVCNNSEEYNSILLEEKNIIKKRNNILERFEHWELSGTESDKISQLRRLLISRCKNDQEEKLVMDYIRCLKEA